MFTGTLSYITQGTSMEVGSWNDEQLIWFTKEIQNWSYYLSAYLVTEMILNKK